MKRKFKLSADFKPQGDQITAIESLLQGLKENKKYQVLMGITGSGKTFTIANLIEKVQRPVIVISHNKTLAAQLYSEFKEFFPRNRVNYFVSYYDYYQPEAYIPEKDMFIEKDAAINVEIDRLRHVATHDILTRPDTIIISSVSCIYGLGSPELYKKKKVTIKKREKTDKFTLMRKLVSIMYERNDYMFQQGKFRAKGDTIDIFPMYEDRAIRIELFDEEIERMVYFDPMKMEYYDELDLVELFPAKHYLIGNKQREEILKEIKSEMKKQEEYFLKSGRFVEAQRVRERVLYDIEMIQEMGYTKGIENYSRYFDMREAGAPAMTLLDYLPENALYIIDESHVTIPQLRGMHNGDHSRKENLINYGFRLPSAFDNRPLRFEEFLKKATQVIFVTATPGDFELELTNGEVVEQVIRPTGLLDPEIEVESTEYQMEKLLEFIEPVLKRGEKILITTLTKKMSEELTYHLISLNYRVKYLHSEIETIERYKILKMLRENVIDIIIGVNLLREGIDLPEVSLVVIFDADKEGFLRSYKALIQIIGRTARNVRGKVVLFADRMTDSMKKTIDETNRRRKLQMDYNKVHNITPRTIVSKIKDGISFGKTEKISNIDELEKKIRKLKKSMDRLAAELNFEEAAKIRDEIIRLRKNFIFNA
ncbi:excinuclease ABC subunit UvrB [bacterium]|nr:excinuclease ABC subunit UvrB [bacterium]